MATSAMSRRSRSERLRLSSLRPGLGVLQLVAQRNADDVDQVRIIRGRRLAECKQRPDVGRAWDAHPALRRRHGERTGRRRSDGSWPARQAAGVSSVRSTSTFMLWTRSSRSGSAGAGQSESRRRERRERSRTQRPWTRWRAGVPGLMIAANRGDGGFAAAVDELIGRRDPHHQVGMSQVGDKLGDRRPRPIDRGWRPARACHRSPCRRFARSVRARGRGPGGSAAPRNGR